MESLTVVIPTYNEGANIGPLLRELSERFVGLPVEYLVVDDNSKDDTAAIAQREGARVIVRKTERGLATAVVRGIHEARGTFVAVMDADFQHPTTAVRELYETALGTKADLVVGSRYAAGGSEGEFGFVRRTISRGAALMAKVALPPVRKGKLTDPMSGLFLVRKSRVPTATLQPKGYKILLEIVAKSDLRRIEEVGYRFHTRRGGESKLGAGVLLNYVIHLAALAVTHTDNQRVMRFGLVGLSGVAVNLGALYAFQALGWERHLAILAAIEASVLSNFILNDAWTFRDRRDLNIVSRLGLFHLISFGALVANFSVTSLLRDVFGIHLAVAVLAGVAAGFIPNYLGNNSLTYGSARRPKTRTWLPMAILVIFAAAMYLPLLNEPEFLYFDESYYVTVAHQFENGIFEDPCWEHDSLNDRPLNYEHPPLAKLILWASIHAYDTATPIFQGCRAPDDKANLSTPCYVTDHGTTLVTADSRKACFDGYTQYLREHGNPYAWRAPSAVLGILTVLGVALGARRLFASPLAGEIAGAFVLMDTMVLSASRIALLDIYATGFAALAFWAATHPTKRGILGSALFLGLGFACKFYVLFAGIPVLLVSLWMHHRVGKLSAKRFWFEAFVYPFTALAVLFASYTPWWIRWVPERGWIGAIEHNIRVLKAGLGWLAAGQQTHSYSSQPAEWIPMFRPMLWLGPATPHPEGDFMGSYIYSIGNPALWWLSCLVIVIAVIVSVVRFGMFQQVMRTSPATAFVMMARRDQALLLAALIPAMTYVSFFILQRTSYIFYMILVAPLFAIPLGGVAARFWQAGGVRRLVSIAIILLVLVGFATYAPVATGIPIPRSWFEFVMHLVPWMRP